MNRIWMWINEVWPIQMPVLLSSFSVALSDEHYGQRCLVVSWGFCFLFFELVLRGGGAVSCVVCDVAWHCEMALPVFDFLAVLLLHHYFLSSAIKKLVAGCFRLVHADTIVDGESRSHFLIFVQDIDTFFACVFARCCFFLTCLIVCLYKN